MKKKKISKKVTSKKVVVASPEIKRSWWWLAGIVVVLVGWAGYVSMNQSKQPAGINELIPTTITTIKMWDFEETVDMGQSTGWYVTKPVANYRNLRSMSPQQILSAHIVNTTLVDGELVVPVVVNNETIIKNEAMRVAVPSLERGILVRLVATGMPKAKVPQGATTAKVLEAGLKGQLSFSPVSPKGTMVTTSAEVVGESLRYSFMVTPTQLKTLSSLKGLPVTKMYINLVSGDNVTIENLKVDSITISAL